MNLLFGCLYFAVSLYFALFEGVGACLAFCYIPALLLFRAVNGYEIKAGIPELSAINVASMPCPLRSRLTNSASRSPRMPRIARP